jgi:hypothetical protein
MTPTIRPQAPPPAARDRAAGVGRFGGMLTAAVTAAAVFLGGRQFLAPNTPPEVLTPVTEAPPSPLPPATTPPPEAGIAGEGDAGAAADAATASAGDASTTVAKPEGVPTEPTPAKTMTGDPAAGKGEKASDEVNPADKDLARESWRRNKPDVSVAEGKSMILIPLKGSSDDATHKYLKKTHTLVVTLPKAASLNTQRFYKLNKEGFAVLWTDQAETNAKASDGTKLRLVFAEHAVPIVEIRDEFVRVTIARPRPAKPAPAHKAEAREEAVDDDKPKDKDRDDKPKEKDKDKDDKPKEGE